MRALPLAVLVLLSLSCAGAPRSSRSEGLSGRFTLTFSVAQTDCAFAVGLEATGLTVALEKGTAVTEGGPRTYAATEEEGGLVLEGRFPAPHCEGAFVEERWTLLRTGEGLTGVVAARWPVAGACEAVCTALVDVEAVRR